MSRWKSWSIFSSFSSTQSDSKEETAMSSSEESSEDSPFRRDEQEEEYNETGENEFFCTPPTVDLFHRDINPTEVEVETEIPSSCDPAVSFVAENNSGNDTDTSEKHGKTNIKINYTDNALEDTPITSIIDISTDEDDEVLFFYNKNKENSSAANITEIPQKEDLIAPKNAKNEKAKDTEESEVVEIVSKDTEESEVVDIVPKDTEESEVVDAVSDNRAMVDAQIQCALGESDVETVEVQRQTEVKSVATQCEPERVSERVSRGIQNEPSAASVSVQCELQNFNSCSVQCSIIGSPLRYHHEAEVELHQTHSSVEIIDSDTDKLVSDQKRKLPENVQSSYAKSDAGVRSTSSTIFQREAVCKILFPKCQAKTPPKSVHQKMASSKIQYSATKSDSNLVRKVNRKVFPKSVRSFTFKSSETVGNSSRHRDEASLSKHSSKQHEISQRRNFDENFDEIIPVKQFYSQQKEKRNVEETSGQKKNNVTEAFPQRKSTKSHFTFVPRESIGQTSRPKTSQGKDHSRRVVTAKTQRDFSTNEPSQPLLQDWLSSVVCERHSTPESLADAGEEESENEEIYTVPPKPKRSLQCPSSTKQEKLRRNFYLKSGTSSRRDLDSDDSDNIRSASREMKERFKRCSQLKSRIPSSCKISEVLSDSDDSSDNDNNVKRSSLEKSGKTLQSRIRASSHRQFVNNKQDSDNDDSCSENLLNPHIVRKQFVEGRRSTSRNQTRSDDAREVSSPTAKKRTALHNPDEDSLSDSVLTPRSRKQMARGSGDTRKKQLKANDLRDHDEPVHAYKNKKYALQDSKKNKNLQINDDDQSEREHVSKAGQGVVSSKQSTTPDPRASRSSRPSNGDLKEEEKTRSKDERVLPKRKAKKKLYSECALLEISEQGSGSEYFVPDTPSVGSPGKIQSNGNSSLSSHESEMNPITLPLIKSRNIPLEPSTSDKRTSSRFIEENQLEQSQSSISRAQEKGELDSADRKCSSRQTKKSPTPSTSTEYERSPSPVLVRKRKPPTVWTSDSESEGTSRKMKKSRKKQPYTLAERTAIVNYIVGKKLFSQVGGRQMWEVMEKRRVCKNRTWQSMKEHFRKQILPRIESYNLPREVLGRFLAIKQ